jgi:hypothetical protein
MIERKTRNYLAGLICMWVIAVPGFLPAQTIRLEGQIFEYATYYISSFDIQTGASDVQLFRYRLYEENNSYPIYAKIWFRASMLSPALGVNTPAVIVELETQPFLLQADLIIDNRDLSTQTMVLYDLATPPNPIPVQVHIIEMINPAEFDILLNSILSSGRLAAGEYTFEVKVFSGADAGSLTLSDQDSRTIVVQTPVAVNLESPGGALADTSENEIYTTYPVFNWYSQTCAGCENYIRVAEFKREIHTSVEEAIEDETSLPFNQAQGWEPVGSFTSYQYPLSGARPLEYGKIYVWQVKQTLTTTAGTEELLSPIWAFKIAAMGSGPSAPAGLHPVLQLLQQALGEDQFNALFGPGSELQGLTPTGTFTINGIPVEESSISYIINQIMNQNLTIIEIEVEE